LERKAAIYADRPRLIVASEIISDNRRMVLTSQSPRLKKMRQFYHAYMQKKVVNTIYTSVHERETKALALSLLEKRKDL